MPLAMPIRTHYYQQFDADCSLDVPAEAFGGWKETTLTLDAQRTALVVMHAWDCGTPQRYPGWHRCAEFIPRAERIVREVFPPILAAVRRSPLPIYHVVWGPWNQDVYAHLPGHQRARRLAIPSGPLPRIAYDDPHMDAAWAFRNRHVFVGEHNQADVDRGFKAIGFPAGAEPQGDEGVVEDADQLLGLCQADDVNHLIYIGFTVNGCMLVSAGGMIDMSRRGLTCSVVRDATTAIENRESAREEWGKKLGLWYVALLYGFVFESQDLMAAVEPLSTVAAAG